MRRKNWGSVIVIFVLSVMVFIFLFPLVVTLCGSFMDNREIGNYLGSLDDATSKEWMQIRLIPEKGTLRQFYSLLIGQGKYLSMFWNSVLYTCVITMGQVLVASMGAFAFAKMQFKGRDAIFFVYIVAMMMPFQVTMVPNFITLRILNLINTGYSIILPGIFMPFGVFLLRQHFRSIPDDVFESAHMDGAGPVRVLMHIIFPMGRSGIASLGVLCFIEHWNMVEQPLVFLDKSSRYPLSLFLNGIIDQAKSLAFGASVIYLIPMVLVYLFFQESIIKGIESLRLN